MCTVDSRSSLQGQLLFSKLICLFKRTIRNTQYTVFLCNDDIYIIASLNVFLAPKEVAFSKHLLLAVHKDKYCTVHCVLYCYPGTKAESLLCTMAIMEPNKMFEMRPVNIFCASNSRLAI